MKLISGKLYRVSFSSENSYVAGWDISDTKTIAENIHCGDIVLFLEEVTSNVWEWFAPPRTYKVLTKNSKIVYMRHCLEGQFVEL